MYTKTLSLALVLLTLQSLSAQTPAQPTFATVDNEYKVGPEDVMQVWIWKEPDLSTTAVVRPDGKMSLPLIGEMEARGKTAQQLQDEIKGKLRAYLNEPVVTVIVKEINYPKVSVLGQVRKPDVYKIRQKTTVLDVIAMAGGFTDYAKRDKVIVIRNAAYGQQRVQLNLKDPNEERSSFFLQPSDTIYVQ
jgi:polysaccharide biosynthesis/export protein